ncbi:glycosyl hydrolase family 28-related protein [Kitasatospora sp. NPDC088134]|uniref:right-handed parallel beta-helix repeat-containing protein n=1 Tax=Kitasatospora sp. NPDC088134 TaxID=3364071 RepID=UPI003807C5FB
MHTTTRRGLLFAAGATAAAGLAGAPEAAAADATAVPPVDWENVKAHGAAGDGSTDDWTAISAAIAACRPGGVVYFPAGQYVVTGTVEVPAHVTLAGTDGIRWFSYLKDASGATVPPPVSLKPKWGSFTGTALVRLTGHGARLRDLVLASGRATDTAGNPVDGLVANGSIKGVRLQNVGIHNFQGYGVRTGSTADGFPGGWEVSHLIVESNKAGGWYSGNAAGAAFSFADSMFDNCEAALNGGDGWYFGGLGATGFTGVRATWNGGNGFHLTAKCGQVGFTECQTDRNTRNGWLLECQQVAPAYAPAPHVVLLTGCQASRDGRGDNANPGGWAGFRVTAPAGGDPAVPVALTGCATHVSGDDTAGGLLSPDYGVRVDSALRVLLTGCVLTGTLASLRDDAGAVLDTGGTMHNLTTRAGVSYDVPPPALTPVGNAPQPADSGFRTWSFDPASGSTQNTRLTPGNVYLVRVETHQPVTVSAVTVLLASAGAGFTTGNLAGVYDRTGRLLARTADQAATWSDGAGSLRSMPLTAPVTLRPGFHWVALLANAATPPAFVRGSTFDNPGAFLNAALAPAAYRVANLAGSATALPGSFDPAANRNTVTQMFWVGLT